MTRVVCTSCGYVGEPATITKGSFAIELILWLCFIIPGLIYSFWRLSSRYEGCPSCGHSTMIPADSPMARKFVRENLPEQAALIEDHTHTEPVRPSKTAQAAGRALGRLVGRMMR